MGNENRLFQVDRLQREGRVDVEEVEKATETAIRTVEQEEDLAIDVRPLIYKVGSHCRVIGKLPNSWKRTYIPAASWEVDHVETERMIFNRDWKGRGKSRKHGRESGNSSE